MTVLTMAWRNVWRNSRRSWITIAAMTLALVVELVYSGLVTGMFIDMEDDVTQMDSGDIQVMHADYLDRPSLYTVIVDEQALLTALDGVGYAATPRLYAGGLGASGELSAGVMFVGVDPDRERNVLALHTALAEGAWIDPADPDGIVVGRGLARTLGLDLGSEVVVLSQAADGSVANALFTVRGILMSVAAGLDRTAIVMPEATFRDLMVLPQGAHKILIRRPDGVSLAEAETVVDGIVRSRRSDDGAPELTVMTWAELNPILAQMLQGVQSMIVVVYLIVYVAVAILILNAMLMAVFERIREFGVLKAIGYSPLQVLGMMVAEGMIQACVALVLGVALAAPMMWYLQTYGIDVGRLGGISMAGMTMPPIWFGAYTLQTVQVPIALLFGIVFLAVIYPATKAARIRPIDAMRHQ